MSRLDSVIHRLSAQRDILYSVRQNDQLPDNFAGSDVAMIHVNNGTGHDSMDAEMAT